MRHSILKQVVSIRIQDRVGVTVQLVEGGPFYDKSQVDFSKLWIDLGVYDLRDSNGN